MESGADAEHGKVTTEPALKRAGKTKAKLERGHAAAAPPSAASNSRRPMVTVIRSSRAKVRKGNDTTPRACSLHVQGGLVALAYHRKAETIPRGGGSFLSSAPGAGVGETVTFNKDGFSVHKEPEFAMSAPSPP